MLLLTSLFVSALLAGTTANGGVLPPPERQYKILMLLPVSSKSHRNVFMPLANALADRGHEVTMLSNHPLDKNPKNIIHYRHGLRHFDTDSMNMFEIAKDESKMYKLFERVFPLIAKEIYDDPIVKKLYDNRKQYDVIIINNIFNAMMFPFAHEHKLITLCTAGLDPVSSAIQGNFLNPSYAGHLFDVYEKPFSLVDKVKNIFFTLMIGTNFRNAFFGPSQIEMSKRFPDLPPLTAIEANQSLSLINSHFSITEAMPLLPGQVEVGGMHCKPAKPLPQDFQQFLSGDTPVVYMSLGSVARSDMMPKEYFDIIVKTFSKLPYKVLWKYEDESIKGLPSNVMIKKWMPQQDVLAHPNVKVFITHCGGLGLQESIYHGTPMLGLPMFGDQPRNGKAFQMAGIGTVVQWDDLSVESFTEAIKDVVTNKAYHKTISRMSAAFKDQLVSPTDRAVYWTEYVIRHDGATHMRSPELQLSYLQLLHLDILIATFVALYLGKRLLNSLFGGSKKPKNKKK